MRIDLGPTPVAVDESADSNGDSAPRITAIRRDQMPLDLRSAFLPEDVILLCLRRDDNSAVNRTLSNIRRGPPLSAPKCPWCTAGAVFTIILLVLIPATFLISVSLIAQRTLIYEICGYSLAFMVDIMFFIALLLVHMHFWSGSRDAVSLGCQWGVKFHWVQSLAREYLSPSSLVILQQPGFNFQSLYNYRKFYYGKTVEPTDADVDRCIRTCAVTVELAGMGLIEDGSRMLLGLGPWRDILPNSRRVASFINGVYQNYRDWKRWRLAAVVCDRIQRQHGADAQQDLNGRISLNPLEGPTWARA